MIISASRRTDIPSFYSEWFFTRLKEGDVLVRNPMNPHQIGKVSLSPEVVDGIVFWTKNPLPMLGRLPELERYLYYFQFTLNAYGRDVEPGLPSKKDILIPAFQHLSKSIGRERVVWRYDPIFFSEEYTVDYHCKSFRAVAARLGEYTEKCTVSFLDLYRHIARTVRRLDIRPGTAEQQLQLLQKFSEIAGEYGFCIDTCAEEPGFDALGIPHARCIDRERLERLGNCRMPVPKDPNQRPACGCAASIDIGAYNTCPNGCLYCYANHSLGAAGTRMQAHRPDSPLLFGSVEAGDVIKERTMKSYRRDQAAFPGF